MRYAFLVVSLLCLFFLGAQFSSALRIWAYEGASLQFILGFLAPALVPTIIFGAITVWLFIQHKKLICLRMKNEDAIRFKSEKYRSRTD